MTKDDSCSRVFQALSDGNRLKILKLLKKEELCVTDICKRFNITQPSVSHHLDILKRADLVRSEKRGREVYYSFNRNAIFECCCREFKVLGLKILKD
jgi:ArsR family transcriptional regulator